MNEEEKGILMSTIVTLIVKAAPIIEDGFIRGLQYLIRKIPDTDKSHREFALSCVAITNQIHLNPDVDELDKERYSADACRVLARRLGLPIDEQAFKILGLSITPEPMREVG